MNRSSEIYIENKQSPWLEIIWPISASVSVLPRNMHAGRARCCGNDDKRAPPALSFVFGLDEHPTVNLSMPATMMLANKENAVLHAPGHGKANPKTPGPGKMVAAKTPFKIPLNDENTTVLPKTGRRTLFAGKDPSQFVTPVGENQPTISCYQPNSSDVSVTRPPKTSSRRKDHQCEGSGPSTVDSAAGKGWPE